MAKKGQRVREIIIDDKDGWMTIKVQAKKIGNNSQGFTLSKDVLPKENAKDKCWYILKIKPTEDVPTKDELAKRNREFWRETHKKYLDQGRVNAFTAACVEANYPGLDTDKNYKKYSNILRETNEAYNSVLHEEFTGEAESLFDKVEYAEQVNQKIKETESSRSLVLNKVKEKLGDKYDKGLVEVAFVDLLENITKHYTKEAKKNLLTKSQVAQKTTGGKYYEAKKQEKKVTKQSTKQMTNRGKSDEEIDEAVEEIRRRQMVKNAGDGQTE